MRNEDRLIRIAKVLNDNNGTVLSMLYEKEDGTLSTFSFGEIQPKEMAELFIALGNDILENLEQTRFINFD